MKRPAAAPFKNLPSPTKARSAAAACKKPSPKTKKKVTLPLSETPEGKDATFSALPTPIKVRGQKTKRLTSDIAAKVDADGKHDGKPKGRLLTVDEAMSLFLNTDFK